MENLTDKLALYKSLLYETIEDCENLTNEEVIQHSQALDKVIIEFYREQINAKKKCINE